MMSARTRNLLFVATSFLSYEACKEGAAHDPDGGCTFGFGIFTPQCLLFDGWTIFEEWSSVGIALGVVGVGVVIGTIMLAKQRH